MKAALRVRWDVAYFPAADQEPVSQLATMSLSTTAREGGIVLCSNTNYYTAADARYVDNGELRSLFPCTSCFLSGRRRGLANLPAEQLEQSPPKRKLEAAKDDALNAISLGSKQLGSNNGRTDQAPSQTAAAYNPSEYCFSG
jgi:hypothetical protein